MRQQEMRQQQKRKPVSSAKPTNSRPGGDRASLLSGAPEAVVPAVGVSGPAWEQASLFSGLAESSADLTGATDTPEPRFPGRAPGQVHRSRQALHQPSEERHLRAARRLSKEIRALKANPRARSATGVAICGHLLALLDASTENRPA